MVRLGRYRRFFSSKEEDKKSVNYEQFPLEKLQELKHQFKVRKTLGL